MKTVRELSSEQLVELKQSYLFEHLEAIEKRTPSYEELAEAGNIVPDYTVFEAYDGTLFCDDDFSYSKAAT